MSPFDLPHSGTRKPKKYGHYIPSGSKQTQQKKRGVKKRKKNRKKK